MEFDGIVQIEGINEIDENYKIHQNGNVVIEDNVFIGANCCIDRATFDNPKEPASGIEWVMVNGRMVWNHQTHSSQRPGKVLRLQELDPPLMN